MATRAGAWPIRNQESGAGSWIQSRAGTWGQTLYQRIHVSCLAPTCSFSQSVLTCYFWQVLEVLFVCIGGHIQKSWEMALKDVYFGMQNLKSLDSFDCNRHFGELFEYLLIYFIWPGSRNDDTIFWLFLFFLPNYLAKISNIMANRIGMKCILVLDGIGKFSVLGLEVSCRLVIWPLLSCDSPSIPN